MNSVKRKRVFIGIKIDDTLYGEIQDWKENYKHIPVRWVNRSNLHITLVAPWYESSISRLISKLNSLDRSDVSTFDIRFDKVSYGPNPKSPRLIWASGESVKELITLKKSVLRNFGIPSEKREFTAHLTLARFQPIEYKYFKVKKIEDSVNWKMKVNSITLFESKLLRSGVEYSELRSIIIS